MDQEATQALLATVCEISDLEMLETDAENGSWLLALKDTLIAVELEPSGAALRLTSEIGLEPNRADEVLANSELCRGMLRFNGDRHADAMWLGLQTDEPAFILTQQLLTEGMTNTDLTAGFEYFVEFYDAWFDEAESILADAGVPSSPTPPFPSPGMLKV